MADVRREKELAEKRKNEPQLDEQRDQLVRKIFTKFRKDRAPSTVLGMQQGAATASDENKSDTGGPSTGTVADPSDGRPKVLPLVLRQQSEDQQASCSTGVRPAAAVSSTGSAIASAPKKVSKWGKVLGAGGGSTESVDTSVVSQQSAPARIRDSPGRTSGGNGHKVFPKLQKVPATASESFVVVGGGGSGGVDQRQETIHETDERPAGAPPPPSGPEPEEEAAQRTSSPAGSPRPSRNPDAPSPPPPPCASMILPPPPDLDVLAKIEDLRADFKADVQSINQRLTGIEDMIQRIADKLDVLAAASAPSPMTLLQPPGTPDMGRGCRTKSTDDLSSPITPKLPPMVRRRRSKSRTRSSSSALPPMRPYSPRDTSPPPFPRSESLKKPCPPRPNDFL